MASQNISADTKATSESPDAFEKSEHLPAAKKTFFTQLTEDWWAVIIGGILITAILLFAVASPGFQVYGARISMG